MQVPVLCGDKNEREGTLSAVHTTQEYSAPEREAHCKLVSVVPDTPTVDDPCSVSKSTPEALATTMHSAVRQAGHLVMDEPRDMDPGNGESALHHCGQSAGIEAAIATQLLAPSRASADAGTQPSPCGIAASLADLGSFHGSTVCLEVDDRPVNQTQRNAEQRAGTDKDHKVSGSKRTSVEGPGLTDIELDDSE